MLFLCLASPPTDANPPDLVIYNAKIWSDGQMLRGDTISIRAGKIIYVGPYQQTLVKSAVAQLDAKGKTIIPGLIDCHTHLASDGVSLLNLRLRDAKSRTEFIQSIGDAARKLAPGQWLRGSGWSTESWPDSAQPKKDWIDGVTGGRPVVLDRMDGHSVFVNSEALKRARITKDGPKDPPGGVIDRDPNTHEPTGLLSDTAMSLVYMMVPSPSQEAKLEGLRLAVKEANSHGVTSVCDIGGDFRSYEKAFQGRDLSIRFFLYQSVGDGPWDSAVESVKRFKGIPGFIEARGIKAYMDGSMGSRTAYMHEPYTNSGPNHPKDFRGVERAGATNGNYAKGISLASKEGLQVIVHAIGDQANHDILDLFEANASHLSRNRFRVEHAQHLLPEDVSRFGKLGVVPSMQPLHKADDGRYAEVVVGKERCRTSYAFHALLATHANLVFGSDWNVVSCDPFLGIDAAVTAMTLKGDVWFPEQSISVSDALKCYTSRAAYSVFKEQELGQIKQGYRADLVILNESPFQRSVNLSTIHPVRVFVDGRDVTVR